MSKGYTNIEIRILLDDSDIKHWQLAEELGVHEITVCRWLRYELTNDKKEKILKAIERIIEEKHRKSKELIRKIGGN